MSSLRSVAAFHAQLPSLHLLVNNAGVMLKTVRAASLSHRVSAVQFPPTNSLDRSPGGPRIGSR